MSTILAVSGLKNTGKTTLIEKLIPCLMKYGLQVAVIKHDAHSYIPDVPGTDSFRFFESGACGIAIFDGEKFTVTKRARMDEKFLLSMFPDADLILLEGFKHSEYPKLEILRKGISTTPVGKNGTHIALVSDFDMDVKLPLLHLDDIAGIAEIIVKYVKVVKFHL